MCRTRVNQLNKWRKIHSKMEHIREKEREQKTTMELDYQFHSIVTYVHDLSLNAVATPSAKKHNYQVFNWPFQCNAMYCFHLRIFFAYENPVFFLSSI